MSQEVDSNKDKQPQSYRPAQAHKNKKQQELSAYAAQTLGAGNMQQAVALPKGENANEWLAVNTVDLFNEISLLYGIITSECTKEKCPIMSAGPKFEYLWADSVKIKKPIKVSAPEYVDYLFVWVEEQIQDERLFPTNENAEFPKNFKTIVKTILKRLFRVYGHIYYTHLKVFQEVEAEAHLNTCFKHFIYFVREFKLVDEKELTPLQEVIDNMLAKDQSKVKYTPKYKY